MERITTRLGGFAFGGDYNPEQWSVAVRAEDIALMQGAGVNLVSVGIFSWALLEPEWSRYEFAWLDEVLDDLGNAGIAVDLATATASPPPWLARRHPEMLPVTRDGRRLWPGSRQAWCPSSPVYRERSLALVERLAERYRDHPAVAMWHVSNELGCHNARCYCDVSAEAFRGWLRECYHDLEALNDAWGTAFWSQRYGDWEEILPPRAVPAFPNPTQQLDFYRFSSDELLGQHRAERDVLHRIAPGMPVTTNFMAAGFDGADYWRWAEHQDLISNDHYLTVDLPDAHVELSFSADVTRGLARGAPWLLMEHSTSAVNWQPRNRAKAPGEMLRNSMQHVARGSDGVLFFQWRASHAGAEKFHSGMVPHAGPDSRRHREVIDLGATLGRITEVVGSRVEAEVAMVFDWDARWALELDARPSVDVRYYDRATALHAALWRAGITTDIVPAAGVDLARYRLVVVPTLYLVTDEAADALSSYVANGGTVLVTYFSGIVDEHDHVRLGGYPGAFRELLGITVEEFFPLLAGQSVELDDGTTATVWTEDVELRGAEAIARHVGGPVPGTPAITRNEHGDGVAWYVATRLDRVGDEALLARIADEVDVYAPLEVPVGVEVVRRRHENGASYLFLLNHTAETAVVAVAGTELVSGSSVDGAWEIAPGAVAVIREDR